VSIAPIRDCRQYINRVARAVAFLGETRMSDHWIQFVPADPRAQPTMEAGERAVQLLRSYAPEADEVTAEFKEHTVFFYPGENWEGVRCPACGADAEPWWGDAIRRAESESFGDLSLQTPCCGSHTSLNDLHYVWPAAFGRFVLEAMNANLGETTPEQE
jgi:hypothetical protein